MGEEQGDRKAFLSKIGTFFLLIGVLLMILFIASDIGQQTYFSFFFIGVILLTVAWYFKRISAPPPSPSKRFEAIRKMQQRQREARAKKEAEKKEKEKKSEQQKHH